MSRWSLPLTARIPQAAAPRGPLATRGGALARALLARLVLPLAPILTPGAVAAQRSPQALFYYVDREDSYNDLLKHIDRIGVLAPSVYNVDSAGVVWGDLDPRVAALARAHHVPLMPLVVNRGFDQHRLHVLLTDSAAVRRTVDAMAELCRRGAYAGIQVNFEDLAMQDRDAFTRFYRRAAEALHADGREISVAVVHRPDELAGATRYLKWLFENWRAGYDLKALADAGDFITVMTYSEHTRRMPPGPSASLPWVEQNIRYFLKFMPPEKLSLGIPTGAMHWYTSQEDRIQPEAARSYSEGLSYTWAMALLERHGAKLLWSDEHQVPYAFYSNNGAWEWIFLENARSFRAKLGLVDSYHLRGYSVWVLGPEDQAMWGDVR